MGNPDDAKTSVSSQQVLFQQHSCRCSLMQSSYREDFDQPRSWCAGSDSICSLCVVIEPFRQPRSSGTPRVDTDASLGSIHAAKLIAGLLIEIKP